MSDKQIKLQLSSKAAGIHSTRNQRTNNKDHELCFLHYSIFKKRQEISIDQYPEASLTENARLTNSQYNTVGDLTVHWLENRTKRLKHPNNSKQLYQNYIAPSLGVLPLSHV